MIVTYLKANGQVVSIIQGFPTVQEVNNQLLIEGGLRPLLNDLTEAGWGYYKDKQIIRELDEDETELPIYIADLDLESITAEDLPKSEHIGMLMSVTSANAKPAVIRRRFLGQNYDTNCLVTQSVAELYQAGKIQVGDFVLVSFIEEIPNTEERLIAIVTDKIYKSW